ncbi:MAG: cation-translocating P-type ATPase family protein [Planctomycetes bacterium]|nr:cation-translocating P-type ATPase family protein [Planctomycetota bacterium]
MHYIPESTCEMLRGDPLATGSQTRSQFHYLSAPLYVLTAGVATLLLADWILSSTAASTAPRLPGSWPTTLFGYRFALVAAVLGGARILYHALDGLLAGRIGADLALTIACLAAIVVGEHQTAGLVVLISLIGESLEGYTIDRARWAVRQTFALQPAMAHLTQDGRERDVPIAEVRVGDFVVVRPGERVPADGKVVSGRSAIDQSPFTGESLPVDKSPGDKVFAGTLNQFGALTVVAEQIGSHTALARVAELVGSAAARKADLERTVDRLARWFLPAVLGAALCTWIGWRIVGGTWHRGVLPALGVLVVACPCPLVLATPAAVMAALAWLARRGVVVRGSQSLERLARVDTFAFDKTGTLTQGALSLGEIIATSDLSTDEILRVAAIAERQSEHLLARLLVTTAEARGLHLTAPATFESFAGAGVIARVADRDLSGTGDGSAFHTIVVGNRRLLDRGEITFSAEIAVLVKERESAGESPLVVAIDGTVAGVIGVRETIRSESQQVLRELRDAGVTQFALLTGDRPQPADAVVQALGLFDHVATEQLPADKARWIEQARQGGRCVAMVGDGVNDAPALATADVGLALGRAGADLTAEAGDILLLGDPLRPLPGLLRLSRALVRNIWQSIILFAFGLNGLGVLACSFGFLSPVGGALFHEVASLAVMINAMRLLWFDGWSSSTASRWQAGVLAMADWLTLAMSPSRWIFWLMERWQLSVKLVGAAAFVVWMMSGLVVLEEDQQALVTRFGRYQGSLDPGIHWRWPWPLERLISEPADRVRSVGIGFHSQDGRAAVKGTDWPGPGIVEWTSPHDDRESGSSAEEVLLLTADEVPVALTAEVTYRIRDLKQFIFGGTRRPDDVLRAAADGVLRDLAAQASLDQLLTDRRAELERQSLAKLQQRIESYGLGVTVLDLQWLDVHPPRAVVPAYRQVADALEDRELLINEAQAHADRILLGAIGEQAVQLLNRSHAPQLKKIDTDPIPQPAWTLDDALWNQLMGQQRDGSPILSGSAAAALDDARVSATQRRTSAAASAARMERLLAEYHKSPRLTNLQLYWNSVIQSLSNRPLTIVDPRAASRQHLWMGDLPQVTLPVPGPPEPVINPMIE